MKTLLYSIATLAITALLGILVIAILYFSAPDASEITGCKTAEITKVLLCEESPHYVKLSQVSPLTVEAILISEDASFYQHDGFDWREIQNSFWTNLERGKLARGGSTITQQLAKNVFLSGEKTFTRKFTEAILTRDLERILTKKQILEYYLNAVEFGPGVYGIKPAAFHYFGKHPSQLNLLESAYLAFLLPNPKVYSRSRIPNKLSPFAESRIRKILGNLKRYNRASDEEYILALRALGDDIEVAPNFEDSDDFFEADDENLRIAEEESYNSELSGEGEPSGESDFSGEMHNDTDPSQQAGASDDGDTDNDSEFSDENIEPAEEDEFYEGQEPYEDQDPYSDQEPYDG